jgi:hypothetical protein
MDAISIWKGAKRYEDGRDLSNFVNVEFEGETLGSIRYGDEERGVVRTFYRAHDGRIVVHVVLWSIYPDEDDHGNVYVYSNIQEAAEDFRLDLERTGIIERRTLSLDDIQEDV